MEVTIDRPKANAIDLATSRHLGETFAAFRDNPELRVAIITGGAGRFFSAGWDLKAAAAGEAVDSDYGVGRLRRPTRAARPQTNRSSPPSTAWRSGGGFEIALSCDLILAAESASFSLPEINAGTLADAATIKLPRRIPHHIAMDLLLTGRWLDAEEAHRWVSSAKSSPTTNSWNAPAPSPAYWPPGPPLVFAAIKETLRQTENLPFAAAMQKVTQRQLPTVDALYSSDDHLKDKSPFTEKRPPVWRGR